MENSKFGVVKTREEILEKYKEIIQKLERMQSGAPPSGRSLAWFKEERRCLGVQERVLCWVLGSTDWAF